MSTIGGLLLPRMPQYDAVGTTLSALDAAGGMTNLQTRLLALHDMQRQQQTQEDARRFAQQHPGVFLEGEGAQPLLARLGPMDPGAGALTQTSTVPGAAPTTQTIPAYPDASRYAGVSPGGGGPIPPDVAQQVMPTVTPPRAPMATQRPSQEALMQLMRANPDAAFAVMQRQQQMQEQRLRTQEALLSGRTKVAEYIARSAQAVNSQERLDALRQDLQQVAPQWAQALPQYYSKETMLPIIQAGISAKDSAQLRLETWKNQIEEQKLGVQLAQAGYQGLGTDVTGILRGLTDEQVRQFGGRTAPQAIAYAKEKAQEQQLKEMSAAERTKFELAQQMTATQPLQDARKEDAGLFVYKGTGQTVPGTLPYGQVKQLQDEQDPTKGVVKLANLEEKKQLTTLKQLEPVLQQYADLVQYAYGPGGPLEHYTRSLGSVLNAAAGQAVQSDPVFQAKRRALQGQLQSVVRGLGARGDLNEQELAAAKEMLANMDASMGLGFNVGFGIGTGGAGPMLGVKPSFSLPDTPETGINLANELIGTVNRRIGSLLQHEGYHKTPFITLRTNQHGQPPSGAMPQARPTQEPLPLPVPPRTWGVMEPATPGQGTPPARPEGPTPGRQSQAPSPPTATSTPVQDKAYRDYQQQRQAQAPTSAGPTRVVSWFGGPKVMRQADVLEAMRQTGRSRAEVEAAARARGYRIDGSRLPEETMVG